VAARSSTPFSTVRGAPKRAPYVRLRNINWGSPRDSVAKIRFRLPNLRAGHYRLVLYCDRCTAGPLGSLIGSLNTIRVR
jgi:hypothetical protein